MQIWGQKIICHPGPRPPGYQKSRLMALNLNNKLFFEFLLISICFLIYDVFIDCRSMLLRQKIPRLIPTKDGARQGLCLCRTGAKISTPVLLVKLFKKSLGVFMTNKVCIPVDIFRNSKLSLRAKFVWAELSLLP